MISQTSTRIVEANQQALVVSHPGTDEPNGIITSVPAGAGGGIIGSEAVNETVVVDF